MGVLGRRKIGIRLQGGLVACLVDEPAAQGTLGLDEGQLRAPLLGVVSLGCEPNPERVGVVGCVELETTSWNAAENAISLPPKLPC